MPAMWGNFIAWFREQGADWAAALFAGAGLAYMLGRDWMASRFEIKAVIDQMDVEDDVHHMRLHIPRPTRGEVTLDWLEAVSGFDIGLQGRLDLVNGDVIMTTPKEWVRRLRPNLVVRPGGQDPELFFFAARIIETTSAMTPKYIDMRASFTSTSDRIRRSTKKIPVRIAA